MRLSIKATALLALALVVGAGAATLGLLNTTSPAQAAAAALDESAAEVRSALSAEISPDKPLVLVLEIFYKGGYKVAPGGDLTSKATYGERVISQEVLTPDANGNLVSVTGQLSNADGTPPVVKSIGGSSSAFNGTGDVQRYDTNLVDWLDQQLTLPQVIRDRGYAYVGRFDLNGQPSIRYEYRETLSELPNGETFDPPLEMVSVMEFVEANPLIVQESFYQVLEDGTLELEEQTTVQSVTPGLPAS